MSRNNALLHAAELRRRLDASPDPADAELGLPSELVRFVRVLAAITPGSTTAPVAAEAVDEIIAGSRLLEQLGREAPQLVNGYDRATRQWWVAVGDAHRELEPSTFVPPRTAPAGRPRTKPFGLGLYSSSAALGCPGMWWCYLRVHEGSTLFPRPWRAWSFTVEAEARIAELRSARDWVALIESAPREWSGAIYPDWAALAHRWDGVHLTAPAVVATQGVTFELDGGVTAPAYWDVESTLWLRWVARDVRAEPG